jgi:hypothetical protein
MRKSRSQSSAFNPEKFLALDAKKKSSKASVQRLISLRRVVVLSASFKAALYASMKKERPELFVERSLLGNPVSLDVFEGFFRRALAREKLTFSDEIFRALYSDFLRGFYERFSDGKSDGSTNEPNA